MTDREFWLQFYRHLKGLADAAKEMLDEERPNTPGFIIPYDVVRELGAEEVERTIEIVKER